MFCNEKNFVVLSKCKEELCVLRRENGFLLVIRRFIVEPVHSGRADLILLFLVIEVVHELTEEVEVLLRDSILKKGQIQPNIPNQFRVPVRK